MKIISLDPRVNRIELKDPAEMKPVVKGNFWATFEVFHQKKRGQQHIHTGIVHAPNPEMAMVFAKEQFARRGECTNLWVVKSSEIYASSYEDSDIFESTPDKIHRDPGTYKVKDRLKEFKSKKNG